MNIIHPQGLIERMSDGHRRPRERTRYGRDKDGAPKSAENWQIARNNDRRERPRQEIDPLRGRLVDLDAGRFPLPQNGDGNGNRLGSDLLIGDRKSRAEHRYPDSRLIPANRLSGRR